LFLNQFQNLAERTQAGRAASGRVVKVIRAAEAAVLRKLPKVDIHTIQSSMCETRPALDLDRFVSEQNIAHYRKLLDAITDEKQRLAIVQHSWLTK
jgi:hypothetical protein